MWPFRRREQTPAAITAPVIRSDWKGLPALQRAIGEHPLTAPGEAFAGELATRHDPSVVSRTMAHHVSAEAPSGLVLAVGSTSTRSDGPKMTARPRVQRRANAAADANDTAESDGTDVTAANVTPAELSAVSATPAKLPSASATLADLPTTASAASAEPRATSPGVAFRPDVVQTFRRELPIVAAAEAPAEKLTGLAPDAMPPPVGPGRKFELQRSTGPSSTPAPTQEAAPALLQELVAASTPAKLTLGQSRRLGLGAPLRQVPATSVQRAGSLGEIPTPAATPTSGHSSAPAAAPPPVAEAGGASPSAVTPLAGANITAPSLTYRSVQKSQAAPDAGPATAGDFTGVRTAETGFTGSRSQIHEPIPAAANLPGKLEPSTSSRGQTPQPVLELPLQRVIREAPLRRSDSDAIPAELTPSPVAPDAGTASYETAPASTDAITPPLPPPGVEDRDAGPAPLPGIRGLRTAPIQRLPIGPATMQEASSSTRQALPLVSRSADVNPPSSASATQDPIVSHSGPASRSIEISDVTRWPGTYLSESTDLWKSTITPSAAPGFSQPSPARVPLGQVAAATRPPGIAIQRQAVTAAPLRDASRPLPLAPVATMASIQRAQVATMESVQTAIAESTAPVAFQAGSSGGSVGRRAMNLQRAEDEPALDSAPASSSVASAPASGAPEHASGLPSESEMDALAGRLYERIRGRLKSELLVDRERAGLLTDLR